MLRRKDYYLPMDRDRLFGLSFNHSGTGDNLYKYNRKEEQGETGWYDYRARLYDEETGQFYANDPAGQFHSPYSYVGGNPISYNDPTGQFTAVEGLLFVGELILVGAVHYWWTVAENYFEYEMSYSNALSNSTFTVSYTVQTDWWYDNHSEKQQQRLEEEHNDPNYGKGGQLPEINAMEITTSSPQKSKMPDLG